MADWARLSFCALLCLFLVIIYNIERGIPVQKHIEKMQVSVLRCCSCGKKGERAKQAIYKSATLLWV